MLRRTPAPPTAANPWVTDAGDASAPATEPIERGRLELLRPALLRPQPGDVSPPTQDLWLPRRERAERPSAWWLGVHGGAGESTLAGLAPGTLAAGHAWPVGSGAPVLLVARTHRAGLVALSAAAREWASGSAAAPLLGAVLIADAPGRLPRPLAQHVDAAEGTVPALWCVPWCEAWRTQPATPRSAPRAAQKLLQDLHHLLTIGDR